MGVHELLLVPFFNQGGTILAYAFLEPFFMRHATKDGKTAHPLISHGA